MSTKGRRAILIGNNSYENTSKLSGCVNDADKMKKVLSMHEDGSRNYHAIAHSNLSNYKIREEVKKLFNAEREVDSALFYFAGHGFVNDSGGYICGIDVQEGHPGIRMGWLAQQINASKIPEIFVILDCCHAGAMLDFSDQANEFSIVRKGVTILAATTKKDVAAEFANAGIFTSILDQGLTGAAKDVMGNVTAFELYRIADKALTPWQQRPVFKSFITRVSSLRICSPKIDLILVQQLNKTPFFHKRDQGILLSEEMLNPNNAEHDRLIALSYFERSGFLHFPENITLIQAVLEGGECYLSHYGKYIWQLVNRNINLTI